MPVYAFSVIKEMNPDGTVRYYQPGEKIDELGEERVAKLLESGAASNYDRTKTTGEQVQDALAETDKLKTKIDELEAKLAEATKAQSKPESSSTSPAKSETVIKGTSGK